MFVDVRDAAIEHISCAEHRRTDPTGPPANAFTREVAGQATPRVCAARTTISGATT